MFVRGGRLGVMFWFGGCWVEGVGDDSYFVWFGVFFFFVVSFGVGDFFISRFVIDFFDFGFWDG